MKPLNLRFKGIGSYFGESEIDFSSLDDVFLICGETGSGKTTILDAMMYALYGESSGGERSEILNGHYTKKDGEAYCIFEFELSGRRYRFSRTFIPKARAEGRNEYQNCEYYDNEKEIWLPYFDNPRQREVNAKAAELLGLTAEQFRQVVILPQGKFERLLTCPTKEKEELLRTLFGAERFTRISERLKRLADDEKKAIECEQIKIDADLSAAGTDSPEAAEETAHELEKALTEMTDTYNAAAEEKKRADDALSAGTVLDGRFGELDKAQKALEALREKKPDADRLAEKINLLEREKNVLHETDNYNAARDEHMRRSKARSFAEGSLKAAAEECKAAEERLTKHKCGESENGARKEEYIRLTGLREIYSSAEALRSDTEKAYIAGKKLRAQYDNAGKKKADLKEAINAKNAEAAEKEKYADSVFGLYNNLNTLEAAKGNAAQIKKLTGEKNELTENITRLEKDIADAEQRENQCRAKYDAMRKAFIDGISARLAAELSEGMPCPVCGSTHHPSKHAESGSVAESDMEAAENILRKTSQERVMLSSRLLSENRKLTELDERIKALEATVPAEYTEENYNRAKAEYENARKEQQKLPQIRDELHALGTEQDKLEQEYSELSEKLSQARESYSALRASYDSARSRIDADIPNSAALEKRISELKAETEAYETKSERLNRELSEKEQALAAARSAYEAAEAEEKTALERNNAAREIADKALTENNLPPTDEFVPDRENIARLPALSEQLGRFVSALSEAEGKARELERELDGKARPKLEALKKARDEADIKCRELDFNIRSTRESIARLSALAADCRKRLSELKSRREIYAEQREFADAMSGSKGISFTRYVLGVMLDMVTDEANNMLSDMLGGSFRLVRSKEVSGGSKQGLDLMVENSLSEHPASYLTAQLSGGEKFLISLVLGVALSTVVQSRFGGISIDAMFIDEGFGSLDPAALADAVRVIYNIRGTRRRVGIISHVEKLKEEIPCCINVKKDRCGSSLSY